MDPGAFDCQTAMSCNHYPSWEHKTYKEETLRFVAHTDFEVLTLLFQRQAAALRACWLTVVCDKQLACILNEGCMFA